MSGASKLRRLAKNGRAPGKPALAACIAELRKRTGKPVTTTLPLINYIGPQGKKWREIGDFYFPDAQPNRHLGRTPSQAVAETRQCIRDVAEFLTDKPVMLKMVSFPSGGAEGLSEQAQAKFFRQLGVNVYLPDGIHICIFAAYDIPWKSRDPDFDDSEEFVGILRYVDDDILDEKDRVQAKPAVEVLNGFWRLQERP